MPATKRGVYHNLFKSKYTVSNTEIVFFFSSKFYLNKFMSEYQQHRETYNDKMSKLTDINLLNMDSLADITLYQTIEKRGFRAWLKGVDITWQELHRYALRQMTKEHTLNWQEIQRQK